MESGQIATGCGQRGVGMSKRPKNEGAEIVQMNSRRTALADLPPPDTRRWVPRRKAEVVAAVERGVLSEKDACERYDLTLEEFASWKRLVRRHGQKGLRVTQLQKYQERPLRRGVETGT
jgi:transposase-like protein